MARGGRRGGGGMKGPDMSWDDEESTEATPNARKPGPLFPDYYIPVPKPLTASEKASVASLISIRDHIRRGPLYAVVDPTITQSQTKIITNSNKDQPSTKTNPRAGFDPFTDQEKYTMKYHRKKRTVPDLSERGGYTLRLFPPELWGVMDPKRKMGEWASLTDEQKASISGTASKTKKRKREAALKYGEDDDDPAKDRGSGSEASDRDNNDDDDDDVLSPAQKRKKNQLSKTKAGRAAKQKKGLDAEDDYPDVDQQDEDGEGNPGEDEPQDSEFETDEDDEVGADDYNGEQYFDDGADEVDGGGDDDDGGGGGVY